MTLLVEAAEVGKTYRRGAERVEALRGVSLSLEPSQVTALVGPSGSGKTTLLAVLCGWERPDEGDLRWAPELGTGGGGAPAWGELAMVPQALGLIEDLTVAENVALPARLAGRRADQARAAELLERFGLEKLARRLPAETSLGEQQRTAVARALLLGPALIVADEPSAHQDAGWARVVFGALADAADEGAACLIATHDPEGLAFADRVLEMEDGRLKG
jgi:putative ABC transport system ATP-binding protein